MAGLHLRPWEPEETIGSLWHWLVGERQNENAFPDAAVSLDAMRTRMGVMLRGMGGGSDIEIRPAGRERTVRRRRFLERLGHVGETEIAPVFDGDSLDVPPSLAAFATRRDNEDAFLWLAAWTACDLRDPVRESDAVRADIQRLRMSADTIGRTLAAAPGLAPLYHRLRALVLAARPRQKLPDSEEAMEAVIRRLLGDQSQLTPRAAELLGFVEDPRRPLSAIAAPVDYKPFRPVLLWPDRRAIDLDAVAEKDHAERASGRPAAAAERKKAARKSSEQANRRDSLILHRFETILSWADFLDLNRKVEDDDQSSAQKAAEDSHELGVTSIDKTPATRLSFDLDLSPQDVDRERLSAGHLLPEWDHRRQAYLPEHVRVLDTPVQANLPTAPPPGPAQRRRIAAVRRQFEALMPQRTVQTGEVEGDEIDTDAAVRFMADRAAGHTGKARIFRRLVNQVRDLSVATLLDVSRSTESVVEERQVIEIARESLLALGHGLQATGDSHAMYAFSSLKRQRVYISRLKDFDERMDGSVESRIAAVTPGFYTRLGAAVRFVSSQLVARGSLRRLMLIITDGKPNDLDYYEGRYGIEDTRRAVSEARMAGLAVFAITVDRKAESYIPHIFGRNGYAMVSHPARLAEALPSIYRHLLT